MARRPGLRAPGGWDGFELAVRAILGQQITVVAARRLAGQLVALHGNRVPQPGRLFSVRCGVPCERFPAVRPKSYGNLAQRIGRPAAIRAVGPANGSNPIGIVVPCHRVLDVRGSLTGYGGGMERKRWLLQHEGANVTTPHLTLAGL